MFGSSRKPNPITNQYARGPGLLPLRAREASPQCSPPVSRSWRPGPAPARFHRSYKSTQAAGRGRGAWRCTCHSIAARGERRAAAAAASPGLTRGRALGTGSHRAARVHVNPTAATTRRGTPHPQKPNRPPPIPSRALSSTAAAAPSPQLLVLTRTRSRRPPPDLDLSLP
jgi:hypothetical protein